MKTKLTLTLGLMVALSSTSIAQTQRSIPRPLAPGVEFRLPERTKPHALRKTLRKAQQKRTPTPATTRNTTYGDLPGDVAGTTPYDTMLVTGYTVTQDGETKRRATITYDQYGLRKTANFHDEDGALTEEYRYTYNVGAFNYWTDKLVELRKPQESELFAPYEHETREVNADKQLVRRLVYGYNYEKADETSGEVPFEVEVEEVYDYAHAYKDVYNSDEEPKRGHMVLEINDFGRNKKAYAWMEEAQTYVQTLQIDYGDTVLVATIDGDHYTTAQYQTNYIADTDYMFRKDIVYYHKGKTCGNITYEYDTEGNVTYCSGWLDKYEEDTPSQGYVTRTEYSIDNAEDGLVPQCRYETFEADVATGVISDETYYTYEDNGEWTLKTRNVCTRLENGIIRETDTNYQGNDSTVDERYYLIEEETGNRLDVVTYEDGSYMVHKYRISEPDPETGETVSYNLFTYYDASGQVVREVKDVTSTPFPVNNEAQTEYYHAFYVKVGDTWQRLSEYEITETVRGVVQRAVFTFTDEGLPKETTIYITVPDVYDGKEIVFKKTVYTYADNGYRADVYDAVSNATVSEVFLVLTSRNEYYLLADGTYQVTTYNYDTDGSLSTARRTEEKDGCYKYYTHAGEGNFTLSYGFCYDSREVLEDGTEVTIKREWNDDCTAIVNLNKTEEKQEYTDEREYFMYANYDWDEATQTWVGTEKTERETLFAPFSASGAINPISLYDDEYLEDNYGSASPREQYYGSTSYTWDAEQGAWVAEERNDAELTLEGENRFTAKETHENADSYYQETYTRERNGEGRLIYWEEGQTSYEKNNAEETRTTSRKAHTYTYNAYGSLETDTYEEQLNGGETTVSVTRYEYDAVSIYPTRIETVTLSGSSALKLEGRTVSAADGTPIRLYAPDGRLVSSGTGSLTVPAAGLYIVHTPAGSATISVK